MSAWWWVAAAILFGAGEMLTTTTLLLWMALGALATAGFVAVAGAHGWTMELGFFAVVSIACTFAGRALMARRSRTPVGSGLNRRAEQLVGRDGEIVDAAPGEGRVTVDGVPWPARMDGGGSLPAAGSRVRVVGADGIVVVVRPL